MEDERSLGGGFFGVEHRAGLRALSPILLTAALSVCLLLAAILWGATRQMNVASSTAPAAQVDTTPQDNAAVASLATAQNATRSSDISSFGPQVVGILAAEYSDLQRRGAYTPQAAAALATQLAPAIKAPLSYKVFSIADISTTNDTSYQGMQAYQKALQDSMSPLKNNLQPEIKVLALYVQTSDPKYLTQLRSTAQEYAQAAQNASKLKVPSDAAVYHVGILNAMGEFSAVLKGLADNTADPITELALLNTMTDVQKDMMNSFNTLGDYFSQHSKS